MSKETGGKREAENAVHEDWIWRIQVKTELQTPSNWESRWGFMRDQTSTAKKSDAKETSTLKLPPIHTKCGNPESYLPTRLSKRLDATKDDLTEVFLLSNNVPGIIRRRETQDKYYLPCTTSQDYGWKWRDDKDVSLFAPPPVSSAASALAKPSPRVSAAMADAKNDLHATTTLLERGQRYSNKGSSLSLAWDAGHAAPKKSRLYTLERFPENTVSPVRRRDTFAWWGGCLESLN
eukprot:jgi/Hompol1/3242/HPOL_006442-RA